MAQPLLESTTTLRNSESTLSFIKAIMPLVDGIKMACAACIRGHRSTSCNHSDRPLLEVRKKGRPMSQCDHCRDLRKVKQVHVRCNCKPDESEAPKRKGKGKKADIEPGPGPCNCEETGICTCAVPRTTATRTGRHPSASLLPPSVSPSTPAVPEISSSAPSDSSEKSWPSCCLKSNPSSDTPSLKYAGSASTGNTSGSESCCTAPPTPSDGSATRLGNIAPTEPTHFTAGPTIAPLELTHFDAGNAVSTELTHFNPEPPRLSFPPEFALLNYSPMDDPLQFPLQARSHRYTPYPQAFQTASTSYAGPSRTSRSNQPIGPTPTFDNDTLALWEQFLQEDATKGGDFGSTTNTENVSNMSSTFQDFPPPSSCSCSPGSSCVSCSPNNPDYVPSGAVAALIPAVCTAPCTEFDCSTLAAAVALIDEDFPAVGETASSPFPPIPELTHKALSKNQTNPKYSQPFASSTSLQPNDALPRLNSNPKTALEQLGLHSALSGTCTCKQKCSCFLCTAESSTALASGEIADSCLSCTFCNSCRALDQTIADMQRASKQPVF